MNFLKKALGIKQEKSVQINPDSILTQEILDFEIEGSVYQYDRKTNAKVTLHKNATIQFDQDESASFEYFLRIVGKQEKKKDDEEGDEDDAHYFPINHEMEFKYFDSKKGNSKFVFEYINIEFVLDEENIIRVMFNVSDEGDRINADIWKDHLSKILYQTKYEKSYKKADNTKDYTDLLPFIEKGSMQKGSEISSLTTISQLSQQQKSMEKSDISFPSEIKDNTSNFQQQQQEEEQKKNDTVDYNSLTEDLDKLGINSKKNSQKLQQDSSNPIKINQDELQKTLQKQIADPKNKMCCFAKYQLVTESNTVETIEDQVIFTLRKESDGQITYNLQLVNQLNKVIYNKEVDNSMNYEVNVHSNFMRWLNLDQKTGQFDLLQASFDHSGISINIQFALYQALLEVNRQGNLEDLIKEPAEQDYIQRAMRQHSYDYEDEKQNQDDNDDKYNEKIEEEIYQDHSTELDFYEQTEKSHISAVLGGGEQEFQNIKINQGKVENINFVAQNDIIKLYRDDSDSLQYLSELPVLKDLQGQQIQPAKIQTMLQDKRIMLLNQNNDSFVYEVDLESGGKIVRQYQVDEANKIVDMCSEYKNSEATPNQLFNVINHNNIFKMDPRIANANVASIKTAERINKTKMNFTCMTNNAKGNLAVANYTGEIRLYDQVGKIAKCSFPGFGDEILSIDCSKDGQWVLATCQTYLFLLPTFAKSNTSNNGFTKKLNKDDRRAPKRLQISLMDKKKYGITSIHFTGAKFDNSQDNKEGHIVTSTGQYTVIWNFSSILRGRYNDYKIQKLGGKIQEVQFKYNKGESLFAALPNTVTLQNMKKTQVFNK